jgi:uncharacterized repeat protein (TIGR01451 family)
MSDQRRQTIPQKLIILLLASVLMAGSISVGCGPSKDTAAWHVKQAYNLANRGHYDEAIEACDKAIEIKPDCFEAYNNRAYIYNKLELYDLAIADCTRAIELNPDYLNAYNNRAVAYCETMQYELAIVDCSKVIELNPRLARAYNNRAYVYNKLGQYDLAIADATKAIELEPKLALAYNNRASAYLDTGKYDLCIADATKAIELDPRLALAYNNRASAYLDTGKYDLAIADATKAVELDPSLVSAYKNRASAYEEQGKKEEAVADLERSAELTAIPSSTEGALLSDILPSGTEGQPTGGILVNATLDGIPWSGEISYTIEGPGTTSGSSVPQVFSKLPTGAYTITYNSGGPEDANLGRISPSATEESSDIKAARFTFAFVSTGSITVNATLDGTSWTGEVNYTIQGLGAETGSSVPQSYSALPIGTYTVSYNSGGPQGALLSWSSPSITEELSRGEAATVTLTFVSTGGITVRATLDGEPWLGQVNYTIKGPIIESGTSTPQSFNKLPTGTYTISYNSGGPQGASLSRITPSATEELTTGEMATWTLVFVYQGSITVKATLDGTAWAGEVNYKIEGPRSKAGSSVPQSYRVPPGTYTITYNYGGPQEASPRFALLSRISPSATEIISPGEAATLTFVFVSVVGDYGQGADLSLTKTVDNGTPSEDDTITYTITISNEGPDAATNIEITDILPVGVTYVGNTASQGIYDRGYWKVGSLAAGRTATLRITATVDINTTGTTIRNIAEVTSVDQTDPDSTPNNQNQDEDDRDFANITVKSL